jgi:signal transduction histidine kinase/DNA-binding response OmpR family regulator/ligand-binding sensor domain-containing protein
MTSEDSLSSQSYKEVTAIYEDHHSTLWVGTGRGLFQITEGDIRLQRFSGPPSTISLADLHIKTLNEDHKGNLWIGTHTAGLFCWNRAMNTLENFQHQAHNPSSLSHNNIRTTATSPEGDIWIGTFVGLNTFLPETKEFQRFLNKVEDPSTLANNSIRSVFFDKRGSLWVGTYYGGVAYWDKESNRFQNYQRQPVGSSISHNVVSSFVEDEQGNLWIGTEGGGLNYFDRKRNRFQSYQVEDKGNHISGNNVKTLLKDGDSLWIGTFAQGLNLLDISSKKFTHLKANYSPAKGLSSNNIYGLLKADNYLWIATYGGGLNRMDLSNGEVLSYKHDPEYPSSICSNFTRIFYKDDNGQIWLGTDAGLEKIHLDSEGSIVFQHVLPGNKIYSLQRYEKGILLAGSYSHGLFKIDNEGNIIENYTEEDGLPGHTIFGILEDHRGKIWLSTNNGLASLARDGKSFSSYNYSDGLLNLEFNLNAYAKTQDGELLFGGTNGFTLFDPKDIKLNTYVPPVVFTELSSFNKPVQIDGKKRLSHQAINLTESLTLKHNQANFSLSFAALDYFNPANNRYAYMLEGLDQDWKYTQGQTEVNYSIQRHGKYTFRLKGANSDGIWNNQERQLAIHVHPPSWQSWWAYVLYGVFAIVVCIAALRFLKLRHRFELEKVAKEKQEELHQSKMRFFTNIAHEFRTPLTLIIGPLEELTRKQEGPGPMQRQLRSIESNAQRLLRLVNQLLDFRKLEAEHEDMQIAEGNVVRFVEEIFLSFQENARLRNISYTFSPKDDNILLWFDRDKMEKVCYNLLSNAFKFTPDGGQIEVHIKQQENSVLLEVKDNGKGISPDLHDQIFKRFFEKEATFEHSFKGSGIGLAMSRKLIQMHHGGIEVQSEPEKGASFLVQIPKGNKHFSKDEIIVGFRDSEDIAGYTSSNLPEVPAAALPALPVMEEAGIQDEEQIRLLIVEDNQEVQHFIKQIFASEYQLITASDGEEGLAKAKETLPDLILSDVMMPKMDGISFCSEIKTNLETSHIPVILLTARTAFIYKFEGLETGADDYITKPFSPEELKLRVRNILQARARMREKFARVLKLESKEVVLTSTDEIFLEKAIQLVESNMGNVDFSVEDFAYEMAVSRALLFTKIKAITNLTPNNFIKDLRMKRAAQLLIQQKLGVAEVAYQVGFKNSRYFSKSFRKQFGKTPTEYMASKRLISHGDG